MVHVASRDPVQQQMAEVHVHGQVATELPLDGISTYIGTGKFPFPLSPFPFALLFASSSSTYFLGCPLLRP